MLALILLPVLGYAPSLSGGFLWDDYQLINNPLVREVNGLSRIWSGREAIDYYPVYYSAFWLQWRMWGEKTTGYHVVNLIVHILNCLLLWRLLARMGFRSAPLCALLFAIHPVNAATVGWISEQKNTLSLFFALLSGLSFVRWTGSRDGAVSRHYFLAIVYYTLSLLTKPAMIMLPFIFVTVLMASAMTGQDDTSCRIRWRPLLFAVIPFFILALGSALVTTWFQHNRALEGEAVRVISWAERLTLAGQALWFYLGKTLWPWRHCMIYPKDTLSTGMHWLWPWAGWIGIMAVAFLLWVRDRRSGQRSMNPSTGMPRSAVSFMALLYFTLMLTPVLGFVDQGYYRFSFVAEHWMYPALPGILLVLGEALGSVRWPRIGGVVAMIVIGLYLANTWVEVGTYADPVVYFRKAAACNPDNIVAHHNLANELAARGDIAAALAHYREALRIETNFFEARLAVGSLLLQQGDLAAAGVEIKQALELAPNEPESHFLAGLWCGRSGDALSAVSHFEMAWRMDPGNCDTLFNLGLALYQSGRRTEARAVLEEVLRRQPDFTQARRVLETNFQRVPESQDTLKQ